MGLLALHLGLDLGQQHDPTALVVVAVTDRYVPNGRLQQPFGMEHLPVAYPTVETLYQVQSMVRFDLGTEYIEVAKRIAHRLAGLWEWEKQGRIAGDLHGPRIQRHLYVDATGVGRPVVELIMRAIREEPRADRTIVHSAIITAGDSYVDDGPYPATMRVGKGYLVSNLQVLLQQRRCDLPKQHPEAQAMRKELREYEIHVDPATANDTYGAFKVGAHDDLVTALGLACLDDPSRMRVQAGPSLWPG
jgi:hypothetical protein